MPEPTRQPLQDVQLRGPANVLRHVVLLAVALFALLGGIAYLVPAHAMRHDHGVHALHADGGTWPLVAFGVLAGLAGWSTRRSYGAGIVVGIAAICGAVLVYASVVMSHVPTKGPRAYDAAIGDAWFRVAIVGLIASGFASMIAEPLLYRSARRTLEREDHPLPTARAVRTRKPR